MIMSIILHFVKVKTHASRLGKWRANVNFPLCKHHQTHKLHELQWRSGSQEGILSLFHLLVGWDLCLVSPR